MKTHRIFAILTALVFAGFARCFALTPIQVVTEAEAKEMGMELEAKAQGSDQFRVSLELKKEGKLKKFQGVQLWIQEGKKVLYVGSLKDNEFSAKPGSILVAFTIDRSLLAKARINVLVEDEEEKIGGLLRVNEFGYALKLNEHASPDLLPKGAATKPADEEDPGYETPAEIKAMSPRKATVLEHYGCSSMFSTVDGKKFSIGSPAAVSQVVEFLNTLKEGTACELPRAFLDFEKASPAFDTAEKIKAMPPCKATVEHVGVRDSRLKTADGKLFFIGGDKDTPEVIRFLDTLRYEKACQLPDAFLEFVKTAAADTATPIYATVAQVKAMPPCKATVEHVETFQSLLRTADGKKFRIGSEKGEQEVWHFVGLVLKVGQTYELPRAFLDFEERKFFATAEAIAKMPATKAALEHSAPCYSVFKTTEGKHFVIGDPGSKAEVIHFLRSLEEGKTYQFPGVFLEYRKAVPVYDNAEQIKAMPPCRAVFEAEFGCGSPFKTSDGRKFLIGSPGETKEVTDFMRTLKEGQTYEFPRAFLDYQNKQQR